MANVAGLRHKIEFGEIAVQVLLFAMLIHALHAAFENREIAFGRIGVNVSAHVFF
jgi:hypothetical protein